MIVGDLKQAIMGFQGADPRLLEAIENRHRDVADPLTSNWRTQAGLMGFINAIGAGLFGERYIPLTPQRKESRKTSLERIVFATKPRSGAQTIRAQAVGHRIRELLNDSSLTFPDRHTNKARPLRGSDIAVMCPTNRMLASYAETLRAMGIMVRLPAEGWFSTRPVQILWHALSFVANTDDKHAALYMAVTELGSLTLQEGLTQLMDQGSVHDPVLDRLTEVASHGQERSLYAQVTDTIHALGLLDLVATWPEGEQDRANLLRFPAEAAEYVDANREALASGGYYGSVLPSFLAWLSAKSETADKQPDARVIDEEAIELTTWHSSKGREWPVVFVCGLDKEIIGKPPSLSLSYDSFEELSALLDRAQITYSPKFDVPESTERFAEVLQAEATEEARRVLYVALTRARERLILEWPTYLLEKDSRSQFSLLVESCGISEDGDSLNVGDKRFDCVTINGGSELPASSGASSAPKNLPLYGRRAITPNAATVSLTPENRTPSSHTIDPEPWEQGEITIEKYGPGIDLQIGLERTDLGSYLHRCFEVLPSQPDALGALEAETGVTLSKSEARDVSNAVASFEQWIQERFSPHAIQRELPILAIDMDGVVVSGIVDYLVFTTTGVWIVDHKSNRTDDRVGSMSTYRGQLETYAHALKQAGHTVCGIAINLIRFGEFTILSGNQI
jgi:ATP-dependent exoDNAse (exonuclease V) beta subunit